MERILFIQKGIFTTLAIILLLGTQSCKKDQVALPQSTSLNVVNVTSNSAVCGGAVFGKKILEKGVCWNTIGNPTIADDRTLDGSGDASYISNIQGLLSSTTYYLRAYATNEKGTAYGEIRQFTTAQTLTLTDVDGNMYKTVVINGKTWMAENLKVTHYRNGSSINYVNASSGSFWNTTATGAYCKYEDDLNNGIVYGNLYNWYAASDIRNIAPAGWHIPSEQEWDDMIRSLGGYGLASTGKKLRETGVEHWYYSSSTATNESSFSALGSGFRNETEYIGQMEYTGFWTTAAYTSSTAACVTLDYDDYLDKLTVSKNIGFPLRCVKD